MNERTQQRPDLRVRDQLIETHKKDRDEVLKKFGHHDGGVPRNNRYLVHIVSPSEGGFLADYLDIPRENIAHISKKKGKLTLRRLRQQIPDSWHEMCTESSLTFLGHMTPEGFGWMSAVCLADFFLEAGFRPQRVNFFSCWSETYCEEFVVTMASGGHYVSDTTSVVDGEEI